MIIDVFAVPDVHIPFHDAVAWELTLKIISGEKPAYVVQLGDLGDMHAVARHPKKFGREQIWKKEKAALQAGAGELVDASKSKNLRRRVWLQGNHEESYERYVAWNAPQLEEDVPTGRQLIKIPDADVWVPYRSSIDIGKATFAHDIGHSGKNATMQNLTSAGRNIVTGHTHRSGIEWGGTTHGDAHFSLSCGWNGDKAKITYLHANQMKDWMLGLGHLRVDTETGHVWPHFIPYVNYTAEVNGTMYSARAARRAA